MTERKAFSYDAENQQWLEGVDLKPEAEKELEKILRTGDAYWLLPYRWTVEARETGVVAVSLQLYMADVREGEVKSLQDTEWLIECDFKGSIILPKDTDEIRKYGKAFHNCVGGYSSGVVGAGFRLGRDILADLKFLLLFAIIYEGKGAGDCCPLQNS